MIGEGKLDWYKVVWELERRDGKRCHYCGIDLVVIPLGASYDGREGALLVPRERTVDHKLPRILGGGDEIENLVLACRRCNSRKGTRSYDWFMAYVVPGLRAAGLPDPVPAELLDALKQRAARWRADERAKEAARKERLRIGGSFRHSFMGELAIVALEQTEQGLTVTLRLPNGQQRTFLERDLSRGVWREIPR
jgi:hypothetical protein